MEAAGERAVNNRDDAATASPRGPRCVKDSDDRPKALSPKGLEAYLRPGFADRDGRAIIDSLLATEKYQFPAYRKIC
jgi:hypothetical protein